uniref:Ras-related protein Rab7 n=1 Tax=Fagus sylvatica TaxID=28930 RepID=A0A2N9G3J7_FAGSY
MNTWREEFLRQADPDAPDNFPFILLGNKIDIDGGNNRVVSEKQAKEWCASKGNIPYFETSGKEGYNVDEAFLCVAKTALANEQGCELDKVSQNLYQALSRRDLVHAKDYEQPIYIMLQLLPGYFQGISESLSGIEQKGSCAC